ncbi:MAG TPA: efflux RND transporter periplasmic adaptor subunit [Nitrospirota bacterium]|nr:efflux RND transporter periplasmic adaptor subunit [Nitrospirota bacterium]
MSCKTQRLTSSTSFMQIFARPVLGFMLLVLAGTSIHGCKKEATVSGPPDVEVVDVVKQDVQVQKEWVGSMDGSVNAVIRAQVQGYLTKQVYTEGQLVKKGQTLFQIDPRTFQAAVNQAKADVAQKKARWDQTQANLARIKPLAEQNAVSKKDLDDAIGNEASAHSAYDAAKSALDKAQLDLGFTRITSPIDGVAGVAKAQIGNLVGPGTVEELTTVSTVDPIKVWVPISEQEFLHAQASRPAPGQPKRKIELILADGSVYPKTGEFAFADRQVDASTGTLKVAVLFPNPGNVLRPGQYARVRAVMETVPGALVVPQRAVNELQGNFQVAVVGSDNKVSLRTVKPGVKTGSLVVISDGLQPGERIVVEGLQKVKDGMTVNPKLVSLATPTVQQTAPSSQPTPSDMPVAGHEQR